MWISPKYQLSDFPSGLSVDQKIDVFEDRVEGWQLGVAQHLLDHYPHSGFAVLSIATSYFEMIAKYRCGYVGTGDSKRYFKEGVYWVWPPLHQYPTQKANKLLSKLYEEVRCSLYHGGLTGPSIMLTGEAQAPIELSADHQRMVINPHLVVPQLRNHFQMYVSRLRDHAEPELRSTFEARFDRGA